MQWWLPVVVVTAACGFEVRSSPGVSLGDAPVDPPPVLADGASDLSDAVIEPPLDAAVVNDAAIEPTIDASIDAAAPIDAATDVATDAALPSDGALDPACGATGHACCTSGDPCKAVLAVCLGGVCLL